MICIMINSQIILNSMLKYILKKSYQKYDIKNILIKYIYKMY